MSMHRGSGRGHRSCPVTWVAVSVALLFILSSRPVAAQSYVIELAHGSALARLLETRPISNSGPDKPVELQLRRAPDHRWTGLMVGAAILGGLGVAIGAGACDSDSGSSNCAGAAIVGGLAGATLGGVLGGFIGGAIERSP